MLNKVTSVGMEFHEMIFEKFVFSLILILYEIAHFLHLSSSACTDIFNK